MDAGSSAWMDQVKEQLASGPAEQVVTGPGGEQVRFRRSPEPGVAAIVESLETHGAVHCITWDPALSAPKGYPEDLPFLAQRAVTYSSVNGNRQLQWYQAGPSDAAQLAADLTGHEWSETTLPMASMPGMFIRPFRRGDRQRIIVSAGAFLSLVDTRAE